MFVGRTIIIVLFGLVIHNENSLENRIKRIEEYFLKLVMRSVSILNALDSILTSAERLCFVSEDSFLVFALIKRISTLRGYLDIKFEKAPETFDG